MTDRCVFYPDEYCLHPDGTCENCLAALAAFMEIAEIDEIEAYPDERLDGLLLL